MRGRTTGAEHKHKWSSFVVLLSDGKKFSIRPRRHQRIRDRRACLPLRRTTCLTRLVYSPSWVERVNQIVKGFLRVFPPRKSREKTWSVNKSRENGEETFDTYSAHETVGVELAVERWNVIFHDRTIAAGTFGRKHVKVVVAAIWLSIAFMETVVAELLSALGTEEVLGVPGFVQSSHAFLF